MPGGTFTMTPMVKNRKGLMPNVSSSAERMEKPTHRKQRKNFFFQVKDSDELEEPENYQTPDISGILYTLVCKEIKMIYLSFRVKPKT